MRILRVGFLSVFLSLTIISWAFATGPAAVYKVRVAKLELWNGTQWVTAFDGTSDTLDIAAVGAGQSAGNFMSGLMVPDGTYTQMRVTPHPSFIIRGNDVTPTRYTLGTNGVNTGCNYTVTASLAAECTVTLTGVNVPPTSAAQDFSATPIVVKDGVPDRKVRVSFDVSNAISYNGGADEIFPAAPTVTMSVQ